MSEITLENLAQSVKNNNTAPQAPKRPNINPTAIDPSTVGKKIRESKGIPEKELETDVPLVNDAFDAMHNTLQKKKEYINDVVMPIVEANAEEMAIASAAGEDVYNTKMPLRDDSEAVESVPDIVNNESSLEEDIDNILNDSEENNEVTSEEKDINNILNETGDSDVPYTVTTFDDLHENISQDNITEKKDEKILNEENSNDVNTTDTIDDLDELLKEIKEEDTDLDDDETTEELRSRFKESLNNVKIIKDQIDLSKFKIRKNPVSSSTILNSINSRPTLKKADWVLYHTGRSMTFLESRGPELDTLRKTIANSNPVNGVIASIRFIYDHVQDGNKPSFENWCKSIRTEDIESLYFGLYRACYSTANLVARACVDTSDGSAVIKHCGKTSLIDTNVETMVKYENDDVKKEFKAMFNQDTTTSSNKIESELIQISDNFVISYRSATLYSTFIQYSSLNADITEKYSDTLNTMAYIDGFFSIDHINGELIPISIKEYPNNLNKTVISKLKVYVSILKTLTNDQYNALIAKLNSIVQDPKVTYIYPEATCPECGAKLEEESIDSVMNLLFTRAQLAQVKNL